MFGRQIFLRDNSIEFIQWYGWDLNFLLMVCTFEKFSCRRRLVWAMNAGCCRPMQANAVEGGMRNRVEGPAGGLVPGAHHSLAFFAAGS